MFFLFFSTRQGENNRNWVERPASPSKQGLPQLTTRRACQVFDPIVFPDSSIAESGVKRKLKAGNDLCQSPGTSAPIRSRQRTRGAGLPVWIGKGNSDRNRIKAERIIYNEIAFIFFCPPNLRACITGRKGPRYALPGALQVKIQFTVKLRFCREQFNE